MDRLEALTAFVAVVEQGSFAGAARRLSRPPAAVSRAVAELEASLNTRLLNRTTRSVALTEAGMLYLDYLSIDRRYAYQKQRVSLYLPAGITAIARVLAAHFNILSHLVIGALPDAGKRRVPLVPRSRYSSGFRSAQTYIRRALADPFGARMLERACGRHHIWSDRRLAECC